MRRIFAVGCSLTRYHWPTWADILAKEFDSFENWGQTGIGNRAIVERLTELVVHRNLTEDDVILVQWSDPHRFDSHVPHRFPLDGWTTGGSIHNNPEYTPEWIENYWNETSYVMHTLNFIKLGISLLDSQPAKWYMTSMNDLIDDIDRCIIYDRYRNMFDRNEWIPPIKPVFDQSNYQKKPFKKPIRKHDKIEWYADVIDPHPTPLFYYEYVNNYLTDRLQVTVDYEWSKKADDLLSTVITHEEIKEMYIRELGWNNQIYWIRGL